MTRHAPPHPIPRRSLLALAAMLAPGLAAASQETLTGDPEILIAGPAGGRLDRWGRLLSAALQPVLAAGTAFTLSPVGGDDGVTGANQFTARVAPDGNTLMLLPGDAAMAWLVGDPRAKFDLAQFVAVAAGISPAVVMARTPGALRRGTQLRVAVAGPVGPDLAALLGLELAGLVPVPVFGANLGTAGMPSLAAGTVDAVLVRGEAAPGGHAPLLAQGFAPLFSLGGVEPGGRDVAGRDPALAQVPGLLELGATLGATPPPMPLLSAWRGVAAAAQASFALVLPQLAPAALVALWRQAGSHAAAAPALHDAAPAVRVVGTPEAHLLTQAMAPDPAALEALRGWMAQRLKWSPG